MKSPAPLPLGTSSTRHMTEEMSKFAAIDTSESTEAAGIVPAGFRRSSDGSGGRTIHTRGHISGADVFPESHEMPVSARAGFMSNLARQDDSPVASNTARGGTAEGMKAQATELPDDVEAATPKPAFGKSIGSSCWRA